MEFYTSITPKDTVEAELGNLMSVHEMDGCSLVPLIWPFPVEIPIQPAAP
jgi:hypothetical protein